MLIVSRALFFFLGLVEVVVFVVLLFLVLFSDVPSDVVDGEPLGGVRVRA